MATGHYISGIGHGGLIGLLLFGGMFDAAPPEDLFSVAEVSLISTAEFDAMRAPQPQPDVTEIQAPSAPEVSETPPVRPTPDVTPETQQPPEVEPPVTPDVETAPDTSEITPPTPVEIDETVPESPEPPADENVAVVAPPALVSTPRPAPRVAPTAAPAPEPDATPDEVVRDAASNDADAQTQSDETETTAPPEASERIITEADQPSSAPESSSRPASRPKRPTRPEPTETETASSSSETSDSTETPDTPATTQTAQTDTPSAAPTGPPMSVGEKDALRVAVSSCWNVGSLSTDALRVTVTVGVSMTEDGKPDTRSIHMMSSSGGSAAAAKQAYEAARRAIIRCAKGGYDLPREKYSHWREIEMTFNPEKMRIK